MQNQNRTYGDHELIKYIKQSTFDHFSFLNQLSSLSLICIEDIFKLI